MKISLDTQSSGAFDSQACVSAKQVMIEKSASILDLLQFWTNPFAAVLLCPLPV
jgi:hypothetical protein